MVRFLISSKAESLREALKKFTHTVTVEAEYGDEVVKGTLSTLAHHGSRSSEPCPCLLCNFEDERLEAVGLSHLDLDALGGCMAVMGNKPDDFPEFWEVAAKVDVQGPHRLDDILGTLMSPIPNWEKRIRDALHAWWAWSEEHRINAPRDGSVADITSEVELAFKAITDVLAGDVELLDDGRVWAAAQDQLDEESFVESVDCVAIRRGTKFVNHLYRHGGTIFPAVVGYNIDRKNITLSLESPIEGVSCAEIAQKLWGEKAGGHAGIAGSPRDVSLSFDDTRRAAAVLSAALK